MSVKKRRKPTTRKQIKLDKKRFQYIVFGIVAIVILVIYLTGPRGTIRLWRVIDKKEDLEKEIKELEVSKTELDSIKNRLKNDPAYLEKIAREEYNMKKEGEKVIKIETDSN